MPKSFKKFIKDLKNPEDVISDPIHFRMGLDREDDSIIKEPIHFRMVPRDIKEDETHRINHLGMNSLEAWADRNGHRPDHKISEEDKERLHNYTSAGDATGANPSRRLNKALAKGERLSDKDKEMHDCLHRHAHAAKEDLHLYSGTRVNLGEQAARTKHGILKSPAHISASASFSEARSFARRAGNTTGQQAHILHIHVKEGQRVVPIHNYSRYRDEYEHVIPSKSRLKYHGTTEHEDFKVHHFSLEDDKKTK